MLPMFQGRTMVRTGLQIIAATLLACGGAAEASAATLVTIGESGGRVSLGANDTLAQSFTSPGGALKTFSFQLSALYNGAGNVLAFSIVDQLTGTTLFNTGPTTVSVGTLSFDNINVATTAGASYKAVLSGRLPGSPGAFAVLYRLTGGYAGGAAYYNGSPWNGGTSDLNFSATFDTAAVPEPASWAMMVGGFGLIGAMMRRRKVAVSFA